MCVGPTSPHALAAHLSASYPPPALEGNYHVLGTQVLTSHQFMNHRVQTEAAHTGLCQQAACHFQGWWVALGT